MPSRWESLLDQKPIPLQEHLLNEVAKLLAKDLRQWPPPIQEWDVRTGAEFMAVLEAQKERPSEDVYAEALRLARWELAREVDAYDEYMRNKRWAARGLAPEHKPLLLFISRWVVEQMLGLAESTQGKLKRPQLLLCLDRLERELGLERLYRPGEA